MSPQQCLLIAVLIVFGLPRNAAAQLANEFFQQNCTACHTIGGGRLVGPDLKEAVQQKDRAWLEHFIQDPEAHLEPDEAAEFAGSYLLPALDKMRTNWRENRNAFAALLESVFLQLRGEYPYDQAKMPIRKPELPILQ